MLQSVVSKSSRHAVQSKAFRAVSSSPSFAALKKELTQSGNTKDPTSSVTGVAAFFFLIFLFLFSSSCTDMFQCTRLKEDPRLPATMRGKQRKVSPGIKRRLITVPGFKLSAQPWFGWPKDDPAKL